MPLRVVVSQCSVRRVVSACPVLRAVFAPFVMNQPAQFSTLLKFRHGSTRAE